METRKDIQNHIQEIEAAMATSDFWNDKDTAQRLIKELQDLKIEAKGGGKYDKNDAIVSILSGAGGDDAEDFSAMLYRMYQKYFDRQNWETHLLHANENDHGGYRNITFEVAERGLHVAHMPDGQGRQGVYGKIKNESGVHRLVRLSPFNSKKLRHTSFSLVEVIPKLKDFGEIELETDDLEIHFAKSSGPGGQNANKRETAVRITHKPTGLSVHVESERRQLQNKEKALEILKGKLFKKREEDRKREAKGLSISATTEIEWGNQIRSYVLHPYKMVKDHRTNVETHDVESVLEDGILDQFIDGEQNLE